MIEMDQLGIVCSLERKKANVRKNTEDAKAA